MLFTYNNTSQTLAVNAPVVFATNSIQTGCTATHTPSTAPISLNKAGIYFVEGNFDAAASAGGNVTLQLFGNGVALTGIEGTASSAANTDIVNIAFSGLVKVTPDTRCNTSNVPYYLTVVNSGVESVVTNAAFTVKKVC